jgi:hypothetical protein
MLQVTVQYHNRPLEIAVFDIHDTTGHYSGSLAVEYEFEVEFEEGDREKFEGWMSKVEHGTVSTVKIISYEIGMNHDNKADTETPRDDILALAAAYLT